MEHTVNSADRSEQQHSSIQPTQSQERIRLLDILRGFALFGILLMNIEFFNRSLSVIGQFDVSAEGWDWAAGWLIKVLVEGKFYKLFSLLFGMGFAIMLLKAQQQDKPFVGRFTRRMLALFGFGLAHMIFLWSGDILHDYAFGGLVLLGWVCLIKKPRFKRFDNNKSFLKIGLLVLCIPYLFAVIGGMVFGVLQDKNTALANTETNEQIQAEVTQRYEQYYLTYLAEHQDELPEHLREPVVEDKPASENDNALDLESVDAALTDDPASSEQQGVTEVSEPNDATTDSLDEEDAAFEEAVEDALKTKARYQFNQYKDELGLLQQNYWQVMRFRISSVIDWLLTTPVFVAFFGLPLFMLGYWLIATNKITQPQQHRLFFNVLAYVGLSCGFLMNTGGVMLMAHPVAEIHPEIMVMGTVLVQAGELLLSAGYLGAITLLCLSVKWHKRLAWLAPMGQMALTNYIMHSLVLSTLFYGYGGGLFSQVSRAEQVLLAFGILAFQAVFSLWWLRQFQFGPLEWVWRCMTYMQKQPFKRVNQD